jgi:hypothetical protein
VRRTTRVADVRRSTGIATRASPAARRVTTIARASFFWYPFRAPTDMSDSDSRCGATHSSHPSKKNIVVKTKNHAISFAQTETLSETSKQIEAIQNEILAQRCLATLQKQTTHATHAQPQVVLSDP